MQKPIEHEVKETIVKIDYLQFDRKHEYKVVEDIKEFLPGAKLWEKITDDARKLKVMYTWFYRETFAYGSQTAKYMYYKKRGIDTENKWLKKIGYLAVENSQKKVEAMHFESRKHLFLLLILYDVLL
ncbi:hypothetical protein AS859_06160 [Aliarcobacter cryaerophilus]|uniref:Uncharacterized protein n=1 Tax=Aliarcobacter cryaerophilus TaxID=28198 RepID=A0A1V9VB68_9BACT|nr:hypothetical protein AS859_06160 [Aliarcobacter cryaerophilus]